MEFSSSGGWLMEAGGQFLETMTKLPISVSMVSGAEASRIGRALASVADWASEIVVVLNEEARDGTEEIALQYGARVFRAGREMARKRISRSIQPVS